MPRFEVHRPCSAPAKSAAKPEPPKPSARPVKVVVRIGGTLVEAKKKK